MERRDFNKTLMGLPFVLQTSAWASGVPLQQGVHENLVAGGCPDFHLKDYVFNTEAHPFKKSLFKKDEIKKRLGI